MDEFERRGATSPDRAVTPDEIGADPSRIAWRRLRDHAIVRESGPGTGRYYIDVEVRGAVHRARLRFLMVLLFIFILLLLFGVIAPATVRGAVH